MEVDILVLQDEKDLHGILKLQAENLRGIHSQEDERKDGFVTVHHTFDLLRQMQHDAGHIIAKFEDKVVGYALTMPAKFRTLIPELFSMFEMLDKLHVDNKPLKDLNYIVMGQICIDKSFRGKGIFQSMYRLFFEMYKEHYGYIITEVAVRNSRSLYAHLQVGFREIYRYEEPGVEEWVVLAY